MADDKKKADNKKAPRFIIGPGVLIDQDEKRYAPHAGNDLTELAERCNADPPYAELFVWVQGLPKDS